MKNTIKSITHVEWTDPDTGKYQDKYTIYYNSNRRRTIQPNYHSIPTTALDFILNAKYCDTGYRMMQKKVSGRIFTNKTENFHN